MRTQSHKTQLPLIAAVNHATDRLNLYRAELARILCLKCADVSDSIHLEDLLDNNIDVKNNAKQLTEFYRLLEIKYSDDLVATVDDGRLEDVIIQLS